MMDSMDNLETGAAKYGAVEAQDLLRPIKRPEKKAATVALILGCLLVPLAIFAITFYMMSFSVRYWSWFIAYFFAFLTLLAVIGFGLLALGAAQGNGGDSLWFSLLCLLSLVGWFWAIIDGNYNFQTYMQPYYDLNQLNVYQQIDPSTSTGNQYMDFGVMNFVEGAGIDRSKAMAFKDGQTYCAAPLIMNNKTAPASYDFWAVGLDCCTNQYDYNCQHVGARSGLRVARESSRSFYELAVKQASATHDITANSPIFFEMVADPAMQINGFQDEGYRNFLAQLFYFLCLSVALVIMCTFAFSKAA